MVDWENGIFVVSEGTDIQKLENVKRSFIRKITLTIWATEIASKNWTSYLSLTSKRTVLHRLGVEHD